MWMCQCDCGSLSVANAGHLMAGKIVSCGCKRRDPKLSLRTGYGDITGSRWAQIKAQYNKSKKRRGLPFEITIIQVWNLFIQQSRKCALTGQPIKFEGQYGGTASLDRIDSNQGYVLSNIQWVHKDINMMKNELTEGYFVTLCELVVKNRKKKLK